MNEFFRKQSLFSSLNKEFKLFYKKKPSKLSLTTVQTILKQEEAL